MITIFSYRVRHDLGSAPNPFWGVCTLVICKPKIRLAAEIGDWVLGFGSKNDDRGNLSGRLIYLMEVTDKMTMKDYDRYCQSNLSEKIPDRESLDARRRAGDCIYDFSMSEPILRPSIHQEDQRKRDLCGKYALLSNHFWYFGHNAIEVPDKILRLNPSSQGHLSKSNEPLFEDFTDWVKNFTLEPNRLYGRPHGFSDEETKNCASTNSEHETDQQYAILE